MLILEPRRQFSSIEEFDSLIRVWKSFIYYDLQMDRISQTFSEAKFRHVFFFNEIDE